MEIVTSNKNQNELNRIRKCMIEQIIGTSVYFSSYSIIGTETQRIHIETPEPIEEEEKSVILMSIKQIKNDDKFLFCGYGLPIKQLKNMNKCYSKIIQHKNLYYYNSSMIPDEMSSFAETFVKKFSRNYEKIDIDQAIMKHTLGLKPLGLVSVTLEYENGRLYIKDSLEEHSMCDEDMSEYIYKKMLVSDNEVFWDVENETDVVNIERVKHGKSPIMNLNVSTNFEKFKLLLAFLKVCSEENYPMLNSTDIHRLFNTGHGYKYYSLSFGKKLEEEYNNTNIKYYKEHEYYDIEEALAFTIYLSGLGIKHFLFEDKILKSFTVCYIYIDLFEPYPSYTDMKNRVINLYTDITGQNFDPEIGRYFRDMSLESLLNCFIDDDSIVFRDHNMQHINRMSGIPFPIQYYDYIRDRSDGLYNKRHIDKGLFEICPFYDRSSLNVRNVKITANDGKIVIHGRVVAEMEFSNPKRIEMHLSRCWKKGYFLNTFGLNYYMETGEISTYCIRKPCWFSFNNSNEKDLYSFLEFNNL